MVKVNINNLKTTTLRTVHERCFSVFPTNFENFVTWIRIMNTLNFPEQILAKQKRYYDDVYDRFSNVFIVSVI